MQSGDSNLCNDLRKCSYFQEKSEKKRNFLLKCFADTENCRTFASQSRNNEITCKQRNPVISILQLATCDATTLPKVEGRNDGKVTCPLCTQPTALAKMQACKVSEDKQKAINCISQKTE